jgi:23S rRNA (pseudouridine1915-N3)-methyltransferase
MSSMHLTIIAVGKLREAYFRAGVEEYLTRIRHFLPVEQIEVTPGTGEEGNGKGRGALLREAEAITRHLHREGKIVVLDAAGTTMDSQQFSEWMQRNMSAATPRIHFIIGGAWGVAPALLEKADLKLSLSAMTFPHELARLMLVEQIYRALSLWKNLPYHK